MTRRLNIIYMLCLSKCIGYPRPEIEPLPESNDRSLPLVYDTLQLVVTFTTKLPAVVAVMQKAAAGDVPPGKDVVLRQVVRPFAS